MAIDKQTQIKILRRGALALKGQFLLGSNYSFLVSLTLNGKQLDAIYKPQKGQMPLWDFPPETLAEREAAAYIVSEALEWDLVPPTVIRNNAEFGKGSLQVFIPHDPEKNYFNLEKDALEKLRPTALFDMVVNNADRKGSHILQDENGNLRLIDHGLCFHKDPKLRTVIWDFAGQPIPQGLLADILSLDLKLAEKGQVYEDILKHLNESEIVALSNRIRKILQQPVFPEPDPDRRPFPWPLV